MMRWHESGQMSLSGAALRLATEIDEAVRLLASSWHADEERHPATLPVDVLQRLDYLRSFPHQASFAAFPPGDEQGLAAFVSALPDNGPVTLPGQPKVEEILTPAACYHVYAARQGQRRTAPEYVTTANTCFRRERAYVPLRRQWSFWMREIVCLGTPADVAAFLAEARESVRALCALLDIEISWEPATDPFFQPLSNPGFLLQKVSPTKFEAVHGGDLAIASVNLHHDHFGAAFDIVQADEPVTTGCVAFGVERWLLTITERYGKDPAGWPSLADAAGKLVADRRGRT